VSNKFEMLSLAQLIREKSALKDEGVSTELEEDTNIR